MSIASRIAVLSTAAEQLDERGLAGFNVQEVARRSRVSKSTIYRHWPGGLPIAVEAYGIRVSEAISLDYTGDTVADLIAQVRCIAEIYASPQGRVIAQLLGAGDSILRPSSSCSSARSSSAPSTAGRRSAPTPPPPWRPSPSAA